MIAIDAGMGCLYYLHTIILVRYIFSTLFLTFLGQYHPYNFIHFHEKMCFILVINNSLQDFRNNTKQRYGPIILYTMIITWFKKLALLDVFATWEEYSAEINSRRISDGGADIEEKHSSFKVYS